MLTSRQKRFAVEYPIDLNATKAAIRAGYSEKVARKQGCINLANPDVAALIQEQVGKVAKQCELSQEWVLNNLKEVAERCMEAVPALDRHGNETGEFTFQASGANRALELIGKHLGMFVERVESTGKDGGPIQAETKIIVEIVEQTNEIDDDD